MFARRLRLLLSETGSERPAPKAWLDQFFMRSFTGHSAFDHVLPSGDGLLEVGFEVDEELARRLFEQWLRGRKAISSGVRVVLRIES
ncbi:MAG: hypothetical protein M1541_17125 [Acidobacteria bacterium]|nr:hypothetical protein [Acidobacteriota bacterium]